MGVDKTAFTKGGSRLDLARGPQFPDPSFLAGPQQIERKIKYIPYAEARWCGS